MKIIRARLRRRGAAILLAALTTALFGWILWDLGHGRGPSLLAVSGMVIVGAAFHYYKLPKD